MSTVTVFTQYPVVAWASGVSGAGTIYVSGTSIDSSLLTAVQTAAAAAGVAITVGTPTPSTGMVSGNAVAIQGQPVAPTAPTDGQTLVWSVATGTWAPATGGGGGGGVSSVTAADTSIVIAGTGTAPTVKTGTLDVIATQHPPAAAVPLNSKKITGLANGTVSTDAAAFGQIPTALPPNGSASGDLSGTYPSPTVSKVQGRAVASTAPIDGQVLAWSSAASSWVPSSPRAVNAVAEFGVDNTGVTADNSTAINNALQTAATEGFDLYIPPQPNGSAAVVLIQNPIVVGNGSTTTPSAYRGVKLLGSGHSGAGQAVFNQNPYGTADQYGSVVIRWNGAASPTAMAEVLGPIQGWGFSHLTFDGNGLTPNRALLVQAGSFGECYDLTGLAVRCLLHEVGLAATISGNSNGVGNSMFNYYRGLYWVGVGDGAGPLLGTTGAVQNGGNANIGILHDGQNGTNNTCYSVLENVNLSCPGSNPIIGVDLVGCDSIRYRNINFLQAGSAASNWTACVAFHYGSGFPAPKDCVFDGIDFGNVGSHNVAQYNLDGGAAFAANYAFVNRFRNLNTNNGDGYELPLLKNLQFDTPYYSFLTPPSVPASGTAVQNVYGAPCTVYIIGGTVSGVSVNRNQQAPVSLGTPAVVEVPPLGSITVTYCVAPTWQWMPHSGS